MNDDDLITAVRDSFTDVHSATPVERIVTRSRAVRARRRVPALTAALAVTAAAAVAVTSLLPGPQAGGGVSATHSLRARLLAAIDAARGDILMAQGRPSGPGQNGGSEQTLTFPWYPRPGQQVRMRTLGRGADGSLFNDAEYIFTMPAGHGTPAMNPIDGDADLTVTGTFMVVYPARHAWGKWHHQTLTPGLPVDVAGIRRQLATGQFKIIRRGVVNGHKAIELGLTGLSRRKTGLHATAARLWVDAASYLPLRQVLQFSTGRQDITDYRFLPPTAANLAKLRLIIPAGYHRTWLLPGQRPHKPRTPAQRTRAARANLAFAACMHRHGYPNFPDSWGGGIHVGQFTSLGIDVNSPRFNTAMATCGW